MNEQNAKQEPPIKLLPCPVCQQQPEAKPTPYRGLEAVCRTDGCLLNGIWFATARWNTQRFPASTPADAPTTEKVAISSKSVDTLSKIVDMLGQSEADATGEAGDIVARVLELDAKATPGPWISKGYGFGRGPSIGEVGFTHGFQDDCDGSENGENDAELIAFYRTACPQLARTIATLRAEWEGWQPIETAPKDGTVVLAMFLDDAVASAAWKDRDQGGNWYTEIGISRLIHPTHWMHIPAASRGTEGK